MLFPVPAGGADVLVWNENPLAVAALPAKLSAKPRSVTEAPLPPPDTIEGVTNDSLTPKPPAVSENGCVPLVAVGCIKKVVEEIDDALSSYSLPSADDVTADPIAVTELDQVFEPVSKLLVLPLALKAKLYVPLVAPDESSDPSA